MMTIELTQAQLKAFLALVGAVLMVALAPIITSGIMGKQIPDALIAVSDKTITGLIGVLGTLVGVMWQSRPKPAEPSGTPSDPISTKDVSDEAR